MALVFALPAALIALSRSHTVLYDDRVEQTRWLRTRTLSVANVRHVLHDGFRLRAAMTRFGGDTQSVLLSGASGLRIRLHADVPRDVRDEFVDRAIAAAVRAAKAEIERGGRYRSLDGQAGLDATKFYGYRYNLTRTPASLLIAEIESIRPAGVVHGKKGETVFIGKDDPVLAMLLRDRGDGASLSAEPSLSL